VNYPLCTIAHTPRLPEHCVEYVRLLMWPKDNPFGGLSVMYNSAAINYDIFWLINSWLVKILTIVETLTIDQ